MFFKKISPFQFIFYSQKGVQHHKRCSSTNLLWLTDQLQLPPPVSIEDDLINVGVCPHEEVEKALPVVRHATRNHLAC